VPDSTYILTLIANYNDKCFDTVKQSIQVARSPIANFQVKLVGDTCGGIAHPQIVNLSQFANHYSWSLGANQYSYDSIPTANYSIPDTYLIVLVASNDFNCKDTFTQSVTLHPQVNALFAADSTRGCNPFAVQFHSQSLNATTFEWDFHDGETSINENPLHVFANSGQYDVTLIASDNGLCKDTLTFYQYIEVLQSPIADFVSVPVEGSPNDGSVKFYNNTVFGNTYSWNLGDGNFANERDSLLHRYYENDTFSVTLYAQNLIGCRDTVTHYIFPYLFGGLQVPNAFMPSSPVNGTEFFLPIGVGLIDYQIAVYDKWGGIIWESTLLENGKPVEGWDGTDKKGVPVMSGAYLWRVHKATFEDRREWKGMIYEKNGVPSRVGTVTVIR
jgi:PKD repeat protein